MNFAESELVHISNVQYSQILHFKCSMFSDFAFQTCSQFSPISSLVTVLALDGLMPVVKTGFNFT